MSSTIDNINTNIVVKLKELKNIINIYNAYQLDDYDEKKISSYVDELQNLSSVYEFGSIEMLKGFYNPSTTDEQKLFYYTQFNKFINTENILGQLKRIYNYCRKIQKIYAIDKDELNNAFHNYDYVAVDLEPNNKMGNVCQCGGSYKIESKTSESICGKCGNVEKLYGVVFEDEQFFYQEGQRTKHGGYDPTKHCKFWVDRLQAKESAEIPELLINEIKSKIVRDNIWLENLTCGNIRDYLKEIKKTRFNNHVPLIRKIITGKEPPQLTDYELKLVYVYFGRVIQIFNKTKPDDTSNSPYHPFFVYKILEQILNKSDQKRRRDEILACIHLQSRDTLIRHDNIWEIICKEISEFVYTPTDSS